MKGLTMPRMLGNLSLTATQGPRNDLEQKLAGENGEEWLRALKRLLRKENPWGEFCSFLPGQFSLTVDYTQTLEQMIDAGRCNQIGDDITAKHFPLPDHGTMESVAQLARFSSDVSLDDAISEFNLYGLRPATIEELLAFGARYPEERGNFPIIAIGSVANLNGNRYAACFYEAHYLTYRPTGSGWRGLSLRQLDDDLERLFLFLVIRN